jgi:hypothetical protein
VFSSDPQSKWQLHKKSNKEMTADHLKLQDKDLKVHPTKKEKRTNWDLPERCNLKVDLIRNP